MKLKLFYLGFFFCLGFIFYVVSKDGVETSSAMLVANSNTPRIEGIKDSPLPIRLKIPTLKIDARIDSVGLTADGAVGVPLGPETAAWFNLGPAPGEKGSAVIDGHSGWKNNIPAVFDNLNKLKKGDQISVEDEDGNTTTFVVREFRTYGADEYPSSVFAVNDGKVHLNLITCTGSWNEMARSHSKRLVVFTDKKYE